MNLLQKKIAEASQAYYTDGSSKLSDAEFDNLLDQLKEEDPRSELLKAGHGYDVNKDTTPGQKVHHRYGFVGSLDKCHNYDELDSRLKESRLYASLKLDGLSVVLYYQNGDLIQAVTRGKDDIGIDITNKVKSFHKCCLNDDKQFSGAVRGEIVMSYNNFQQFQTLHSEAENARNSAAGLINAKEITDDLQLLDIVVYNVVGSENMKDSFSDNYESMHEWLARNFDNVVNCTELSRDEFCTERFNFAMQGLQSKWYGIYPSDGIVLDRYPIQRSKGAISGYVLLYDAMAFKFPAERAVSEVTDVEWTLSKTRYLIPVVKMNSVRLAGTSVSAATGISAQFIKENEIGTGSTVVVEKANEIIPKILRVSPSSNCVLPENCPACMSKLEWVGVHLHCPNDECSGGNLLDTLEWIKVVSPVERLGDKLKIKFLTQLFGEDISIDNIYQQHLPYVADINSVQSQLFKEMYDGLFSNRLSLADAIKALNVPRFSTVTSERLAQHPEVVKEYMNGSNLNVDISKYIGDANYASLIKNKEKMKRLKYIENQITWEAETSDNGKVAVTGKLSVSRSMFETELKNHGYTPSSSITKDTVMLITDNPNSGSSKNKKADELGIRKLTEAEFRREFMN